MVSFDFNVVWFVVLNITSKMMLNGGLNMMLSFLHHVFSFWNVDIDPFRGTKPQVMQDHQQYVLGSKLPLKCVPGVRGWSSTQ